jgi:Cof subfamily protein (haloacid dehalogenase superfamily)
VFENQVIYQNPLDTSELEKFLKETRKNNHPLVFMTEKTMKATVDHHSYIEESLGTLKFPHPEADSSFYENRNIYQSLLFCEELKEQYYREEYSGFNFVRWHPYSVDVLPSGGSKAEGIKQLIKRLDFELEDVYAFGDGLNDIEMLEAVGTGIAMGNGTAEAKKHANIITTDVDNNGIWNGLKELKLI